MKILYRQTTKNQEKNQRISPFSSFCVSNCYFKWIKQNEQDSIGAKKRHSHTCYEFHIVVGRKQSYETCDGNFSIDSGYFLAIPKGRTHRLVSAEYPLEKYAVTFSFDEGANETFDGLDGRKCLCLPISDRILSNIRAISEYSAAPSPSSLTLVENCVFETLILLLNAVGITEKCVLVPEIPEKNEDGRVELAKQYVSDNIELPISVRDVAAYCYISEKQLTRLFYSSERISPAAYIRRERIKHIEELLHENDITLSEISRRMGFPNESGFNAFFKKHNGMPPGEYRKMTNGGKG